MIRRWTISRATGWGAAFALCTILLWLVYPTFEALRPAYIAALAATGFCGLSILWITLSDMVHKPTRGNRMAPIRAFDAAVALLLAVPSLSTLHDLLR